MKKILLSILIGMLAGGIAIIPIIIKKYDPETTLTAFLHVTTIGILIPYINMHVRSWFKGLLIMVLTTIPLFVIVSHKNYEMMIPVILLTAVLGLLIGMISGRLFYHPGIK
jgi:hypothetical protein